MKPNEEVFVLFAPTRRGRDDYFKTRLGAFRSLRRSCAAMRWPIVDVSLANAQPDKFLVDTGQFMYGKVWFEIRRDWLQP